MWLSEPIQSVSTPDSTAPYSANFPHDDFHLLVVGSASTRPSRRWRPTSHRRRDTGSSTPTPRWWRRSSAPSTHRPQRGWPPGMVAGVDVVDGNDIVTTTYLPLPARGATPGQSPRRAGAHHHRRQPHHSGGVRRPYRCELHRRRQVLLRGYRHAASVKPPIGPSPPTRRHWTPPSPHSRLRCTVTRAVP